MKKVSIILMLVLVIASIAGPTNAQKAGEYGKQVNYTEKFYGVVESMPQTGHAGMWIVNGRDVQVGQDTVIKEKRGKAGVGSYVEVKGQQTGDTFTAYKIEVEGSSGMTKSPYPGKFYGTVDGMPETGREGIWIINGREILVTGQTRIEEEHGKAAPGAYVEVEGDYAGKTFNAYEIEVKGEGRHREYTPSRDKTDNGRKHDYVPYQEKTYNSRFSGIIESMPDAGYEGRWIIDGRTVEVTARTLIDESDGRAAVGSFAKVKGMRTADAMSAIEIEIGVRKK